VTPPTKVGNQDLDDFSCGEEFGRFDSPSRPVPRTRFSADHNLSKGDEKRRERGKGSNSCGLDRRFALRTMAAAARKTFHLVAFSSTTLNTLFFPRTRNFPSSC